MKKGTNWTHIGLLALGGFATFVILAPPLVSGHDRNWAKRANCASNLKWIGFGLLQYARDYNEYYPPVAVRSTKDVKAPYGWADALCPYTKSLQGIQCPSEGDLGQNDPTRRNYTDYWFNANLSRCSLMAVDTPAKTIMSGDGNWGDPGSDITDARYALTAVPRSWLTNTSSPAYRHLGSMNLLCADGHIQSLHPHEITSSPARGPLFAVH